MAATVTSVVTFHSFNQDPLPPPVVNQGNVLNFIRGDVVGGDDCLNSEDGDGSYIRYLPEVMPRYPLGWAATAAVVTCRAAAEPAISATAQFIGGTAAFQVRAETNYPAPYDAPPEVALFHGPPWPSVTNMLFGNVLAAGPSDPPYGTTWHEGTDDGSDGFWVSFGPALLAGGYFVLSNTNGNVLSDNWVRISYLKITLDWQPTTPAVSAYLRMNQRNDGLGIHAHPRIPIGPNRPSSIQSAQLGTGAPRIGTKNRYL